MEIEEDELGPSSQRMDSHVSSAKERRDRDQL